MTSSRRSQAGWRSCAFRKVCTLHATLCMLESHCMCPGDSSGVPYSVRKPPGIPKTVESPYPPMIVRYRLIWSGSSGRYTIASFEVTELRYGRRCPRASREARAEVRAFSDHTHCHSRRTLIDRPTSLRIVHASLSGCSNAS
ncbi:hypothetical protein OH76DRAFT_114720 [Lentinus brumalis]|uniref:Uncharacterized protein n=1 Tax=Lentinus brumalis TaxID=2498619 RepID=A0A371CQ47_9APHY|nr:hypothetical protein OH76DRAFT_114720 [Polyporus brumalis]